MHCESAFKWIAGCGSWRSLTSASTASCVALKVRDVCHGAQVATRAIVMQRKTQRPVQFEITQATRDAVQAWIRRAELEPDDFLFLSRLQMVFAGQARSGT